MSAVVWSRPRRSGHEPADGRRSVAVVTGASAGVGSALAFRGIPLQAAYCGSKFAVRGFMQALRTELLHEGCHIRVSMVHLPAVNTPQFDWCRSRLPERPQPVAPVYQAEVAAREIVAVASTGRRQRIVGAWN